MSPIYRVFYASRAAAECTAADIKAILHSSRRNNDKLDVTGCLLFSGTCFAQVVEGRAEVVRSLLERIALDHRHTQFRIFTEEQPGGRDYGSWSMGYLYDQAVEDDLQSLLDGHVMPRERVSQVMAHMRPDTVLGALS